MKPSPEEFLTSCARWHGKHRGIRYELSWHGMHSEHQPQGIWCWYIHLDDEQFQKEDWQKLRLKREDKQLFEGRWHRHYCYDDFPDLEAHGGWTFGEMTIYLGRDGKEHEHLKVGCDYNHLWDHEGNYYQGKQEIERDVKRSIDLFLEIFTIREKCAYSGTYGEPDEFYTAINGKRVHKTQESKIEWPDWKPAMEPQP